MSRYQKDFLVVFLYKHVAVFWAERLVSLYGLDLRRQRLSLVNVPKTSLLHRAIIDPIDHAHWMFLAAIIAVYKHVVERHL